MTKALREHQRHNRLQTNPPTIFAASLMSNNGLGRLRATLWTPSTCSYRVLWKTGENVKSFVGAESTAWTSSRQAEAAESPSVSYGGSWLAAGLGCPAHREWCYGHVWRFGLRKSDLQDNLVAYRWVLRPSPRKSCVGQITVPSFSFLTSNMRKRIRSDFAG